MGHGFDGGQRGVAGEKRDAVLRGLPAVLHDRDVGRVAVHHVLPADAHPGVLDITGDVGAARDADQGVWHGQSPRGQRLVLATVVEEHGGRRRVVGDERPGVRDGVLPPGDQLLGAVLDAEDRAERPGVVVDVVHRRGPHLGRDAPARLAQHIRGDTVLGECFGGDAAALAQAVVPAGVDELHVVGKHALEVADVVLADLTDALEAVRQLVGHRLPDARGGNDVLLEPEREQHLEHVLVVGQHPRGGSGERDVLAADVDGDGPFLSRGCGRILGDGRAAGGQQDRGQGERRRPGRAADGDVPIGRSEDIGTADQPRAGGQPRAARW